MDSAELSLLSPDLTFIGVEAKDSEELFKVLGAELDTRGLIQGTWMDAILERERVYPTGLTCPSINVAIPHTDPVNIAHPYIAVIKPVQPVELRAMSDASQVVPAELVVNLGIVHSGGQVKVLQLLMMTFMNEAAVADIRAASSSEELYQVLMRCMAGVEASL